jgi:hypothetical protein
MLCALDREFQKSVGGYEERIQAQGARLTAGAARKSAAERRFAKMRKTG